MTKRPPFIAVVLVVVVCFALGILNVLITGPEEATPPPETPYPTQFEPTETPIQSILIVGVDDLRNLKPKIRAIWIAAYRSTEEIVYLHGLSLDTPIPDAEATDLQSHFSYSHESGPGDEFMAALYETLPLQPSLIIVMDDIAFASVVDYLGGIELQENFLDGYGVLTLLSLSWDQPRLLLENQAKIIQALIPKALQLPESPELTDLFGLVPSHAYLSMDISTTVAKIYPLRQLDPDSIFLILPEVGEDQ
jgi:hypothetical protein